MDTNISLDQISIPISTKIQIYNNGDGAHKIIFENVKLNLNETTVATGILTIYRVQGITILNNFDEMEWKDIATLNSNLYCLPNEKDKIYDIVINSIMD